MTLVVLIVRVVAATARRIRDVVRRRRCRVAHPAAPVSLAEPEYVERMVTTRLLAGQLPAELYRDCMAAIAATTDQDPAGHPWSPGAG